MAPNPEDEEDPLDETLASPSKRYHDGTSRDEYSHQYQGKADPWRLERDEKVKRRMMVGGDKLGHRLLRQKAGRRARWLSIASSVT